jgi:hypothetical protein
MTTMLTRGQATTVLAERAAERDQIQANLLDLEASFGKRLLSGASLTGTTRVAWQEASADLASVWEIFTAYSAVVQRAAEIHDGARRPNGPLLTEMTALLTGPSVRLTGEQVPLARRQLTDSSRPEEHLDLTTAVGLMTTAFGRVADVTGAAESVWNEVSDRLDQIASVLTPAASRAEDPADSPMAGTIAAAEDELRRLRDVLNSDPLSLWDGDQVHTSALDQLQQRCVAAAAQAAEMARLRADADRRITRAVQQVAVARACEQDASAVLDDVTQKIVAEQLPAMPATTAGLGERLTGLQRLKADERWPRLAAELDAIEKESAAAAARWQEAAVAARALLDRRGELRGLLDAYRAKAGRLGAAESPDIRRREQNARDLLWSAPCDLDAAGEAVHSYQQAVLGLRKETP